MSVPAAAAPITWTFTAVVRVIQLSGVDALPPDLLADLGVGIGAEVRGSLTWESTTPDVDPHPLSGAYNVTVTAADFSIGDWSLTELGNQNHQWLVNDHRAIDRQAVAGFATLSDPTPYAQFETMVLELSGQNITPGDAQPVHPPSLDAIDPFGPDQSTPYGYGSDLLIIGGLCASGCYTLRAELTSLVPEPGSLALCALAALALAGRRR